MLHDVLLKDLIKLMSEKNHIDISLRTQKKDFFCRKVFWQFLEVQNFNTRLA